MNINSSDAKYYCECFFFTLWKWSQNKIDIRYICISCKRFLWPHTTGYRIYLTTAFERWNWMKNHSTKRFGNFSVFFRYVEFPKRLYWQRGFLVVSIRQTFCTRKTNDSGQLSITFIARELRIFYLHEIYRTRHFILQWLL